MSGSPKLPSIVNRSAPSAALLKNNRSQSHNAAHHDALPQLHAKSSTLSPQRRQVKGKKKPPADEGVRSNSRVGLLLAEFGGQGDWCSLTILKHKMAVIIQSVFRGHMVRKRWQKDPQLVVDTLHAKMERERMAKQRRAEAIKKLEEKTITSKQKNKWGTKLTKAFGAGKGSAPKLGGKWGKLGKNLDIARGSLDAPQDPLSGGVPDPESGSDYSDLELDNISAIKLRAVTPPWQKTDESKWMGQFQKLQHKVNRGNLDILWNTEETEDRLNEIVGRRRQREKAGQTKDEEHKADQEAADKPLSHNFITQLLQDKYSERWARLQLNDPNSNQKQTRAFSKSQGLTDFVASSLNHTRPPPPDDDV